MHMDAEILDEAYTLTAVYLEQNRSRTKYLLNIIRALWTVTRMPITAPVLIWFADYHAAPLTLLAKARGLRVLIFVGGYDAVNYPEFRYGVHQSRLRGYCARLALKRCDHIIANHAALLSSSNEYYNPKGHPEGVYRLIPGLGTPASVIHNAVIGDQGLSGSSGLPPGEVDRPLGRSQSPDRSPAEPFRAGARNSMREADSPDVAGGHRSAATNGAAASAATTPARISQILTVGSTPRLEDFYNKGYDLLARVAARRPELMFVWVGIDPCWLTELNAKFGLDRLTNLTLIPQLPQGDLHALMRQSAVYAQPSISEGMPNALMEAMLMGCLPVGSRVAGIPTVIGDWGLIIDRRDSEALEDALDQALSREPDRAAISRSVRECFNRERRREGLLRLLS